MPTPIEFKAPFHPEAFYHIVCKSIDGIKLFQEHSNYFVFQERFKDFTGLCFDVWSYCLLSNHTHHIIQVKEKNDIIKSIEQLPIEERTTSMQSFLIDTDNEILFDAMIVRQMNRFLVSYANNVNNRRKRKGGTFQKPFRRRMIENDSHLQQAIIYTNANAQKHQLIDDYKKFRYSSYSEILAGDQNFIEPQKVINFFGSIEKFIKVHQEQVDHYYQNTWPSSKLE